MTQTRNALVFAPEDIVTERNAEPQVRAVSWYPRLMTAGPHLALSPAVFWLVASLKPDCAVTLGLGQGHLFFAVAQGLDKLASDGRAIGIAGSADDAGLIAELIAHLHQLYRDNAQIVPADHSEGMQAGVDRAGINLLIVDPARIDPMTAEDAAAWLARMHPDAIIALVGGPADHDNAVALRLAIKDWQTQHLRVGFGLTLFQRADGLLTAPVFSSAGQNVLRRIGEGLEAIAGRDAAVSALSRRDTQLAEAGAALKVAEARYSQLEAAHHLQGDKRAVLESTLFDQQGENRDLSDRIAALAEAHEQARAEIARLQAEGEEDRASIVRQAGERLILTKIAEEMRGEIARLLADSERQSAEQQAEIERHLRAAPKYVQEIRTLKAALKQAKATARAENARRATIQQSLSWRVTAPMRELRSMFKRR